LYICLILKHKTMKRAIMDFFLLWKNSLNRKPLIVRGARQVGKTYAIEEFGKDYFDAFVKINFEETPELKDVFKTNDVAEIIQSIELFSGTKLTGEKALLFLDEIQACPEAITTLRYFFERIPGLHVISAGSLLDHLLNKLPYSMPVGRVEFAYMYPMNFNEFLMALGEMQLVDYLNDFSFQTKISTLVHNKLLKLVRLYYFIGGMPEAVNIYHQTQSLQDVERVHESVLKSLEFDFGKYGTRNQQELLVKLLRYIPKGIGRKFKYVNVDPAIRSDTMKEALQLLVKSRIVCLIKSSTAETPPLEYGVNDKVFKPLFLDIGLANHLLNLRLLDIDKLITTDEGSLAEQFVGQQLLAMKPYYVDKHLYYWNREKRNSEAEIDYLTEINNDIIPVEVKAGKSGTMKSLHIFMAEKKKKAALRVNADIPSSIQIETSVMANKETKRVNYRLLSIPFYLMNEIVLAKSLMK